MDNHTIMGVHITDRMKKAPEVQAILSQYGCFIRTRLGLHEATESVCSPRGLVLLELVGDAAEHKKLQDALSAIDGIDVKVMVFDHE